VTETQRILADLVAFDTTSRTSNLPLLAYVEDLLDAHGIPHRAGWTRPARRRTSSPGSGRRSRAGWCSRPTPTASPSTGQPWTATRSPPPRRRPAVRPRHDRHEGLPRERAGAPAGHGRGAVARPDPARADLRRGDRHGRRAERRRAAARDPAAPRGGDRRRADRHRAVVTAHKGVRAFTTVVEGRDGHSSQPQLAANALAAAARIATFIDDLAARHRGRRRPDLRPALHHLQPRHPARGPGHQHRAAPRRADLGVPARPRRRLRRPGHRGGALRHRGGAAPAPGDHGRGHDHHPRRRGRPGCSPEPDGAAEALVRRLTGATAPGGSVPFGTDGGHLGCRGQAAGLSTARTRARSSRPTSRTSGSGSTLAGRCRPDHRRSARTAGPDGPKAVPVTAGVAPASAGSGQSRAALHRTHHGVAGRASSRSGAIDRPQPSQDP
jgi:acetylornithine deacetylase